MRRQPHTSGSTPARDSARTRRALLDAAKLEFAEHGYAATTARRISARAGVSQALVFRYFGSKRNLYELALAPDEPEGGLTTLLAVLRQFVRPAAEGAVHPVQAMLRSLSTQDGAETMHEQMRTIYLPAVRRRIAATHPDWSPEQCAIRAELAWAWILGIGVVRSVVELPAVSTLDPDRIEDVVTEILGRLLLEDEDRDTVDQRPDPARCSPAKRDGEHEDQHDADRHGNLK